MQQYSFFPDQVASRLGGLTSAGSAANPVAVNLTIESLGENLKSYLSSEQVGFIKRAYYYAEQAHEGQRRRSGEAYVTHPLAVASILCDMHMDHESLAAAMLHDVIEDTPVHKQAIEKQFGETVANLVDGVSKLTRIEGQTKAEQQAESFQKMALALAKDIRVILVKLADRLHNMRTLGVVKPETRRRVARETLEIYAPIAQRLGMHNIRTEIEDLGFDALYPMRAERVRNEVNKTRGNRKEVVDKIEETIAHHLTQEGHSAQVSGREKHLYSIYQKMRNKGKSFSEIMDLYAFRVVVDSVDICYRVLGCVHSLYKPVPGQFKDYIAIPKVNSYQSLHTVLFGPGGVPIEIQIRTQEMEDMANAGIAAHWLYKSNKQEAATTGQEKARRWVKGLLEMQETAGDSMEFIENVKIDLFPDEVYVFTPKGDIMELPQGATAIDFAYAVHSDVGNSCVACRINRRLAPLSGVLESGQTIEVITSPGAQPSPNWLEWVVTAKARSSIRHYLKTQRLIEAVTLGKRLLDKALQGMGSSLDDIEEADKDKLVKISGVSSFNDILEEIGLGNRVSMITARRLLSESDTDLSHEQINAPVEIHGTEGLIVSYGGCCFPIPGDEIVGITSAEKGLVVHTDRCHNSLRYANNPERSLPLAWAPEIDREFPLELRLEITKNRGIVATLATLVSAEEASIKKISQEEDDANITIVHMMIGVSSRIHLARIISKLHRLPGVNKVEREKH